MTSLTAHAQQPPYGAQFFYAPPHYINFASPRDFDNGDAARLGAQRVLPAPPQDDADVRAARLAHLAAHDAALERGEADVGASRRLTRDTFLAVRPVLAVGPQFEASPPLDAGALRLVARLRTPSVSQQAAARGALPVAAVHDQQVSPLQTRGQEAVLPVHLHRAATAQDAQDTLRAGDERGSAQLSLSARAALFGAVPVAAVHDQQVAPGQWAGRHQTLPLYVETFE